MKRLTVDEINLQHWARDLNEKLRREDKAAAWSEIATDAIERGEACKESIDK